MINHNNCQVNRELINQHKKGDIVNLVNNDNLKVLPSSDAVKMKGEKLLETNRALKYPFGKLTIGNSFGVTTVNASDVISLNNALAYYNRKGPGKYVIVNHSRVTPGLYEVGMVSDGLEEDAPIGEMTPICSCSLEVLNEISKVNGEMLKTKYPFRTLNVGESFVVSAEDLNKRSLTVSCSKFGKVLNRKFVMKIHDNGCCEVGRIK